MPGSIEWLAPLQAEARQRIDATHAGQDTWRLDPESWKYTRIADFLPEQGEPNGSVQPTSCDQGRDFRDLQGSAQARCRDTLRSTCHPLADLNLASLDEGLMVHCARGESKRVRLGFRAGYKRLLLNLEAGSALDLLETSSAAHNLVIHVLLNEDATLTHRRLGSGANCSWTLIDAKIDKGAHYDLTGVISGPTCERVECRLALSGENAHLSTRHLLLGRARERLDLQLGIDHKAAHSQSRHLIKTLAGDASQVSVRGRMYIAKHCPGADAELNIKSLRVSDQARINAKPELEIYTDDVACAHGTSIAEIDSEQLFYLASRGVALRDARALLLKGFASDCLFSDDELNRGTLERIEALAA